MTVPGPRPGTLEWLADQRPDEVVLRTPDGTLTRAAWEARADALAEHLAAGPGIAPGDLLTAAGRIDPAWFVAAWAAAKLGAGLVGLPPGPVVALDGAVHLEEEPPPGHAPRRFSGAAAPPDSVTFSRLGRPVRRSSTPASVAAVGESLADLVARLGATPGTTLVVCGAVSDPVATFLADVVLAGGGRVLSAREPAAALALAAEEGAGLAALPPAELDALAALDPSAREALVTTGIAALVTGAAAVGGAARAAADDLFGSEAVVDVYATADTGVVAVRPPGGVHHVLLDRVAARITAGGLLEVRSPLAAAPGWVPTGDRAALTGDAELELL